MPKLEKKNIKNISAILSEIISCENTANQFGVLPKHSATENVFESLLCYGIITINAYKLGQYYN